MRRPAALPTPTRRLIALIRVSQASDELTSPDIQRHSIQTYADQRGDHIIDWVEGIDVSGSRTKSAWWAVLDAVSARVEAGEADGVVVWRFSRAARHRLRWALVLDRIEQAGGVLESSTEQTPPTPEGRLTRGMMGEMNAYQAEVIGAGWRETHDRRRRAGLPPTGGPRFGYVDQGDRYTPDPHTGPQLATLYRWYLEGGGWVALAKRANAAGMQHPSGRPWTFQAVTNTLDSGFGAGLIINRRPNQEKQPQAGPPSTRTYLPGAHPPVITPATWEAYVAERQRRYKVKSAKPSPYLLAGLVRCTECGAAMYRKNAGDIYVCGKGETTAGLTKTAINAPRLEAHVTEWVLALTPDIPLAKLDRRRTEASTATNTLRAAIAKLDDRIANLAAMRADDELPAEAFRIAVDKAKAEQTALRNRLTMATPNPAVERTLADLPADLAGLWPHLTTEHRQRLLGTLIARVEVAPAKHRGDRSMDRVRVVARWDD